MKPVELKSKRKRLRIALSVSAFLFVMTIHAQVTIGSAEPPHTDALLDLKETGTGTSTKGFLMPRVALSSTTSASPMATRVEGMTVYNTATAGDVTPGYYYSDHEKWVRIAISGESQAPCFFYMPSVVLPTDTGDPAYDSVLETFTVDLYGSYAAQFGMTATNAVSNTSASSLSLPVVASNALDYYITYYDEAVFDEVKVSDAGELTYKLVTDYTVSENTFMNIVFKEK